MSRRKGAFTIVNGDENIRFLNAK